MLRARNAKDIAYANAWSDLIERLRRHHVVLTNPAAG